MALKICSIASGSKGNSIYIASATTNILIDLGISLSTLESGLGELGADVERLDAVLLTHEHTDHIRGLPQFAGGSGLGVPVYAHGRAVRAIKERLPHTRSSFFEFGDVAFKIGDIEVTPFRVPHDTAYPVGFAVREMRDNGGKIAIATDLGFMTRGVLANLAGSDIVFLESNHDEAMLRDGKYPEHLKRRILGRDGHLSNRIAALTVQELLKCGGLKGVMLAHLSEDNNTPELALAEARKIFEQNGKKEGNDILLAAASQHQISPIMSTDGVKKWCGCASQNKSI